jgi:hypothetical protein
MINHDLIEALIISEIAGDITDEEKSCLYRLLLESKEARDYADKVYNVLLSKEAIVSRNTLSPLPPDLGPVKRRISPYYIALSIAAMLAVVVYVSFVFFRNDKNIDLPAGVLLVLKEGRTVQLDNTMKAEVAGVKLNIKPDTLTYQAVNNNDSATLIVPEGKHQFVVMSDGTRISVNPGTTVRFPLVFKGSTRGITVHGEAYIDVAPDEKRPFFVHMNKSTVQVLGTEFNVNSHDGQELISLVTGKVNVHAGKDCVSLSPGKQVLLRPDGRLTISEFNTEVILKRQKGLFVYAHKTPKELEKLIQRYYGVEVRLNDGDQKLVLSGLIDRNKSIQEYLNRLKMPYVFIGDSTTVIH